MLLCLCGAVILDRLQAPPGIVCAFVFITQCLGDSGIVFSEFGNKVWISDFFRLRLWHREEEIFWTLMDFFKRIGH